MIASFNIGSRRAKTADPRPVVRNPSTFSNKKNGGLNSATRRAKVPTRVFLGSLGSRLPAEENPWQGGPPAMSVNCSPPSRIPAASNRSVTLSWSMSASRNGTSGKLHANVSLAAGQLSTARAALNPARFRPRERPPAPQNKSMAFGSLPGPWWYTSWSCHEPLARVDPSDFRVICLVGALVCRVWWARQVSNLRPIGYEPTALPLSYGPSIQSLIRGQEGVKERGLRRAASPHGPVCCGPRRTCSSAAAHPRRPHGPGG